MHVYESLTDINVEANDGGRQQCERRKHRGSTVFGVKNVLKLDLKKSKEISFFNITAIIFYHHIQCNWRGGRDFVGCIVQMLSYI